MLSKLYEAKTFYSRVNHPRNEWLFDKEWGVDVAVSSPRVICGLIEKDLGTRTTAYGLLADFINAVSWFTQDI
jgi:hypothetical protein